MISFVMQDRRYQRKKHIVEKFIKKFGKVDHSVILNNVDIDYDTLMKVLSDLRNEGRIK
jgi:UDP-N-acetylmuramate-alanine ligase